MPILTVGKHRNPRQGACFMEFASYLSGERWSDHPACTHPLIATLARDVNDLTSNAARSRLMPLVHRVVGLNSDDPLLAASVAVRAAAAAIPIVSMERQRALAVGMLSILARFDSARLARLTHDALLAAPDADRWAQRYLAQGGLPGRNAERANEAIIHTATVGIALACLPHDDDADARLARLLTEVIEAAEQLLRPPVKLRARALV